MIRYEISLRELKSRVETAAPGWLAEAKRRTAIYRRHLAYSEPPDPTWSKIKSVYMQLQFNKCAYCEEKLVGGARGAITHDIEHYRPKSSVLVWPTKKMLKQHRFTTYTFPTGDAADGYYLLPYHVFNYATACKICNSSLKRDRFPIKGQRITNSATFSRLKDEKPFLLYPVGAVDEDDPEELITFQGFLPIPNPDLTDAAKVLRARVTIDFFELDIREPLIKRRAEVIKSIFEAWRDKTIHPDADRRTQAGKDLDRLRLPSSPHTNCARKFYDLCVSRPGTAYEFYKEAVAYIEAHPEL